MLFRSDPQYSSQWSLPKIGWDQVFGSVAPAALSTVAILDTGVDATHPELAGRLVQGTSILDGGPGTSDPRGHGTAMAGIVAAAADNGAGIAGIGYAGVQIMPVTVLGADGTGLDSDVIAGVVWAVDHGADVILMAFSNPAYSTSLQSAIDYAWSHGAVLVAATGNDGVSSATYPAGDRGVIGVSGTDQGDLLAPGSNYGADVFLAAPGVDIPTLATAAGYTAVSGTSAAAAHVAAAAALLRATDPFATNGMIVTRLGESAAPAGSQDQTGNGRLDLARAIIDTSTTETQPAGVLSAGGPYVGPYVAGAAISITANTNWSAITTGSGTGGAPTASDTITISNNATLTVNVSTAVASSITITGAGTNGTTALDRKSTRLNSSH